MGTLAQETVHRKHYLSLLPLQSYRDLFSQHFDILQEQVLRPGLGKEGLTPEVRADLKQWSEEELLSNNVRFVLRPRK